MVFAEIFVILVGCFLLVARFFYLLLLLLSICIYSVADDVVSSLISYITLSCLMSAWRAT